VPNTQQTATGLILTTTTNKNVTRTKTTAYKH